MLAFPHFRRGGFISVMRHHDCCRVLDACADLACRAGEVIRTHLEDAGGSMSVSADKADFGYGEPDPQTLVRCNAAVPSPLLCTSAAASQVRKRALDKANATIP